MFWPLVKLRLETNGRLGPLGKTETKPLPSASVAVTFRATAMASAGTGPTPATVWRRVEPAKGLLAAPPALVSMIREGVTGTNFPGCPRAGPGGSDGVVVVTEPVFGNSSMPGSTRVENSPYHRNCAGDPISL